MSMDLLQQLAMNVSNNRWANEFTQGEKIGKGGFASVYKARNHFDENHYAVKKIKIPVNNLRGSVQEELERVLVESEGLSRVNHHNILKYYNSWLEVSTKRKDLSKAKSKNKGGWRELSVEDEQESDKISTYDSLGDLDSAVMTFDRACQYESEDNHFIFEEQIECSQSTAEQFSKGPSANLRYNESSNKRNIQKEPAKLLDPVLKALSTGLSEEETIEKITFFIQTELCKETLGDYIAARNKDLASIQTKNPESYKQVWNEYLEEAIAFAKQILEGLNHIHSEGIIHRDLKPHNIFISDKACKIGDFGLIKMSDSVQPEVSSCRQSENCDVTKANAPSKHQHSKSKEIMTGAVGTKLFASPEQWEGDDEKFDFTADIYSLGIVFLLMFHPMGTIMEELQVVNDSKKGQLPSQLEAELPEVAAVIKKMLAVDPCDRPSLEKISFDLKLPVEMNSQL